MEITEQYLTLLFSSTRQQKREEKEERWSTKIRVYEDS
jgi:hypothetical protein